MGAWLKLFKDGTQEHGTDEKIARGDASWTRGRLKGIKEVRISNTKRVATLTVPETSWHQFDRFEVIVGTEIAKPNITHKVVQAEIRPHHTGQSLVCSLTGGQVSWAIIRDLKDVGEKSFFYKLITKNHIGKWLTVILPEKDYPAVIFSTRGKMNDNQYLSR